MKINKKRLREIVSEQLAIGDFAVVPSSPPRDLGYGEGEGRMSKSQLDKIARYSQSLHDKLLDDDDLPEWVQAKISVAAENIGKVYHYLEYKIRRMEQKKAPQISVYKEEKMKITKRQLRKILKEYYDFDAVEKEMIPHVEALGKLLSGRPDVAMKIRDALSDNAPFPKAGAALYKAYSTAQAADDDEYMSFGAGYDDDDY